MNIIKNPIYTQSNGFLALSGQGQACLKKHVDIIFIFIYLFCDCFAVKKRFNFLINLVLKSKHRTVNDSEARVDLYPIDSASSFLS